MWRDLAAVNKQQSNEQANEQDKLYAKSVKDQ